MPEESCLVDYTDDVTALVVEGTVEEAHKRISQCSYAEEKTEVVILFNSVTGMIDEMIIESGLTLDAKMIISKKSKQ